MMTDTRHAYRWIILSLLFAATTINYFDRIVLSVLIPEIKRDLNLDDIAYSHILSAFQLAYTIGFIFAGRFVDWLGVKAGYSLAILFWSIAGAMHTLCSSAFCLSVWRGMLGITASGNFPAAIKAVAEWFQVKDRSFATSLFNSGASIASIVGPPLIAAIALTAGWRLTFFIFGAFGFILVIIWAMLYQKPPQSDAEIRQTRSSDYSWRELLRFRQSYGIMVGKFLTDPVWWFYLYWMPNYLAEQRGFDLKGIAIAIPVIYIVAIVIGIAFGWLPGFLMNRGYSVARARKTTMLATALLLPVSALAVFADNVWIAILLVSLACGAHNGWSANIFTLISDCYASRAVGSMTGLAGFAGGLGGLLIATMAPGYIITYVGYVPIFVLMGALHPLAYLGIRVLIKDEKIIGAT
jgi:ACS family hexuronate transporter-like MFS transporter